MAKLNPSLIFSMTRELSELHEIGQEMIEHIGSCEIVSWRFPDRAIKDVKIDLDRELFDTSEKYILLLELIIDRLYLIVNMSIEMFNALPELSNKKIFKLPKNVCKPSGLSFGTLMTFFWNRLKFLIEFKDKKCISKSNNNTEILNSICNLQTETTSQTCESCSAAMKMVKNFIIIIEECMNNLKLESQIVKHRSEIEKTIINLTQFNAMLQWTNCIETDIKNLAIFAKKHASENCILNQDFEKIKQENISQVKKLRIIQNKCIELEKSNKDTNTKLSTVTEMKNDSMSKFNKLTADLTRIEEECKIKSEKTNELETKIQQMVMENEKATQSLREDFHKQIANLNSEKDFWTDLYNKSKAEIEEYENNIKLQQENHTKIEIQLHDNFSKEKQKIYAEKLKIEEQNLSLIQEVELLKNQITCQEAEFKMKIHLLEDEKLELQDVIKACKEKELILIRCPDLNGPIVCQKGTQNPLQDMEQQLESNEIRVKLLEEQNTNLRRTIDKMKKIKFSGK